MTELGYERIAHVPVLFDGQHRYCREYNRYLRERATLEWTPPGSTADYPGELSLRASAYHLSNWIKWCEKHGIAFGTATYDHVLRYQQDQEKGRWSSTGKPLEPSTANARADEVTFCLTWGASRKLRGPFDVKTVRVGLPARHVGGGRTMAARTVQRRVGRAKESYSTAVADAFLLPTPADVKAWLHAVRERRGRAKYLCCRFVLECGPRRHEVEALTVGQWPARSAIDDALARGRVYVPMKLLVTKGRRPRTIKVPVRFADEVRLWIDGHRNTLVYRLYKREGRRTDKLFVSDSFGHQGIPLSAQTIYDCFHEVKPRPSGWSPHKGRHAFACFFVLHALETEALIDGRALNKMPVDWITNRGEWWLKVLQRQFGHSSPETTEVYLQWLVSATKLAVLASGWHRFLNSDDNTGAAP
ncbi:MAG: site-specific integrase [Xanthobacteraceae bacterium]|nr:site-specific integrase [Xanthobacteraceae bacterium]